MATLFSKIIDGEIPGRFVWRDEVCVAFLTIEPLRPGHTLVVPREEVAVWTDLDADTWSHVSAVAQTIGAAQRQEWESDFVGLLIAGFDVPHVHVHVWPTRTARDMDMRHAQGSPDPAAMDEAAARLRARLRARGADAQVPTD